VSPTPPGATHASLNTPRTQSHATSPPDFQLTVAKTPTRHSMYLPESSARYRAIRENTGAGAVIEICPDLALYASDFGVRIGGGDPAPRKSAPRGAALILDYGPGDGSVPANTLRGIRSHVRVSPFAEPGQTDLSADVDFGALAEAALRASDGVEVHGPVEQGHFLEAMGIRERAEVLVKALRGRKRRAVDGMPDEEKLEQKVSDIERAWKRLIDRGPNGMGRIYKALAIVPENGGRRRPVGFGGSVVG
jgi:NADH dehydrogenase [ubiquinone] 1 alpha subcomplex assembly factor 7